jgi:hypothetical protein
MTTPTKTQGIFSSAVAATPAVMATGTNGAAGIEATSDHGPAVVAQSTSLVGVYAVGPQVSATAPDVAAAIFADGGPGSAIWARGVSGVTLTAQTNTGIGIDVDANTNGTGISVVAGNGTGIKVSRGILPPGTGDGGNGTGVEIEIGSGTAVNASSGSGTTVNASSRSGNAVAGTSQTGNGGVFTTNGAATAVLATAGPNGNATAVHGINTGAGTGIYGESVSGNAVAGHSQTGNAGLFNGNVQVNGTLTIGAVDVVETITELTNRIAALEQQVAKLNTHYHIYGPATFYSPDSSESVSMYSVKEYILSALNSNLPGGTDISAGNFDKQLVELRSETGKTVQADVEVTGPPQFGTPGPNTIGP